MKAKEETLPAEGNNASSLAATAAMLHTIDNNESSLQYSLYSAARETTSGRQDSEQGTQVITRPDMLECSMKCTAVCRYMP